MLLPIFILCLSHLTLASPLKPQYDVEDTEQLEYIFNDFKINYNRSYTAEEEGLRFHYFKENLAKINELNKKHPETVFGINKFADWSVEEIKRLSGFNGAKLGGDYGSCTVGVAADITTGQAPAAVDWREKNAVAPVQNQQTCGSCWTFSTAAALEGAYAVKHKNLLKLSEQQFLDCDTDSDGCEGGLMHTAISSAIKKGGVELEKDYPYENEQGSCRFDVNKAKVKVKSCKVYPGIGDQDDKLASLLATVGPLSIALFADLPLLGYHGGIFHTCDPGRMNHAVTLVGYGEEGGIPFWIIKNSWGAGWGEKGYVRVKRGVGCLQIGQYVVSAEVD